GGGARGHRRRVQARRTRRVPGPGGHNLGPGQNRGRGHLFRPDGLLGGRLNSQLVESRRPDDAQSAELRFLVERHREYTGSVLAAALLADWDATVRYFWWVAPVDEVARIERAHEGMLGASA